DYAWSGQLDAPRFNPKPLLGDSALTALAVALTGHGDRHSGTLTGRLDLNDYPLLVQPLSIQLSHDLTTLTLQKLKLGSPKIKGELEANGTLQLDAKPLSAELAIRWTGLELPHDLVGQTLSSEGQLQLTGNLGDYHAEGALSIGPPGQTGQLALNLDGDAQQITVHTLALEQAHGKLQTNGTLTWQPAIAWQAEAKADHFDPGKLFAGWN
ncbi:MAG: translocation/assembly module TamB domain-containing protein, partial [Rhodanobacter sp.]